MKREVIYRTDAMAAVGNLKGLSDTDRSKAMQAVLDLPAVQTCEDAVSRQAAIDELYKMLHDCFWADDEELDAVITTLNELPSVQPETHDKRTETHACDLIDRHAAIDALDRIGSLDTEADKKYARSVFEALPSAQPQYEELTPEEVASEIASGSTMTAWYWLDDMIRIKQMGYVICKKTM